jgi:hypothetical protein
MLWNSGAIFFHRDQLLTWVHAIRWNPPFGAIHLTDSRQWQAFLGKSRLEALELEVIVAALRDFLLPPVSAAKADIYLPKHWPAGGPWAPAAG